MHTLHNQQARSSEVQRNKKISYAQMIKTGAVMTVVLTILVGVIYPFSMTGLAQVLFQDQANGSLITDSNGQVIGSSLIGQKFTKPQYFHPRRSAAGAGYEATSSAGTNQGPTNATLIANTIAQANTIRKEEGLSPTYPLPADAVSTSASGLDPHISPAYADLQVARVARVRHLSQNQVRTIVAQYTSNRDLGVFGEPRVNVLQVNVALDKLAH